LGAVVRLMWDTAAEFNREGRECKTRCCESCEPGEIWELGAERVQDEDEAFKECG